MFNHSFFKQGTTVFTIVVYLYMLNKSVLEISNINKQTITSIDKQRALSPDVT